MKETIQPSRQNWVTRIVLNLLGTATMMVESLKLGTAGLRSGMTMNANMPFVCLATCQSVTRETFSRVSEVGRPRVKEGRLQKEMF